MQTNFTPLQLGNPDIAEVESILRKCVHCGFCTATCPTYVTEGNELDSPRGRIYLIKDMFENGRDADAEVALHVDRCLSCLACTTTCPSGVDYMHLIDQARVHVEKTYKRPLGDRLVRSLLASVLPYPRRFRLALRLAPLGRPFASLLARLPGMKPLGAMMRLAPKTVPVAEKLPKGRTYRATGSAAFRNSDDGSHEIAQSSLLGRVAMLSGCAQSVLDPGINRATASLLNRIGISVILPKGEGCCGALNHHMGRDAAAISQARSTIDAFMREIEGEGLDAILITASGCGTVIKDYGHLFRHDAEYRAKAERVAGMSLDITEYLSRLDLPQNPANGIVVAYHSACSLQHGQKVTMQPKTLLKKAGFTVREPAEGHLCCGSAGTYNILQSDISEKLKTRKARNLKALNPEMIATGNIGCMTQLKDAVSVPILHTIELLDWAYGGKPPQKINQKGLILKSSEGSAT